jgi:hypothetical protein
MTLNKGRHLRLIGFMAVGIMSAVMIAASPGIADFATFQYVGPPGGTNQQDTDWGDLARKVMTANATLELSTGSAGGAWTASASSWSISVGGALFLDSTMPGFVTDSIFIGTGAVLEEYRLSAYEESGLHLPMAGFTYWFDPNVQNPGYDWALNGAGKHTAMGDQTVTFAPTSQVPVPPSIWLCGCGLVGLMGFRRFRRS